MGLFFVASFLAMTADRHLRAETPNGKTGSRRFRRYDNSIIDEALFRKAGILPQPAVEIDRRRFTGDIVDSHRRRRPEPGRHRLPGNQFGEEGAVAALLQDFLPQAQREPGVKAFQIHQNIAKPREFFFYEVFAGEAAFADHQQTDHFKNIIVGQAIPKLAKRERSQFRFI